MMTEKPPECKPKSGERVIGALFDCKTTAVRVEWSRETHSAQNLRHQAGNVFHRTGVHGAGFVCL